MLSKIRFALSPIQCFIIKKLFLKYQRFCFYFTYIRLNLQMHCEIVMEKRNFWNIESIAKPVLFLLGTSKNSQSHKYQEKTFFTDCVSRLSQNKRSLTNYHWRADFSSTLRRHQAKLPTHDVVNNFFKKWKVSWNIPFITKKIEKRATQNSTTKREVFFVKKQQNNFFTGMPKMSQRKCKWLWEGNLVLQQQFCSP